MHFFPATRAATLYPGVVVKEGGQRRRFAGVSQTVGMFLGKKEENIDENGCAFLRVIIHQD